MATTEHPHQTKQRLIRSLLAQPSKYDQLHRDIVIYSDIYGSPKKQPRILAAGYGFEGIQGVPGLNSVNDIKRAAAAGAGIVASQIPLPNAPLRNITSAISLLAISAGAGFSDEPVTETFMDAMPIEFSHPVLPSTVLPQNFEIELNTGEIVEPHYVALNPNYEFNERQTVVAFGYFGNRLPTADKNAEHPSNVRIVNSGKPLQFITPKGLFDGTGLSKTSSNPYDPFNGPTLVGAKLSQLSLAGDYGPDGFTGSEKNHGVEYYGKNKKLFRLRLFTSGGFSPNGVSGFRPDQFENFFQLTARGRGKRKQITLSEANRNYPVKGGKLKILGIADLGPGLTADPAYIYAEDHDNQFDLIIHASSTKAAKSLQRVIIPDPRDQTHSPIYNPGGPGTDPRPLVNYTQPSGGQNLKIEKALKNPRVVSWASQTLSDYDNADNLAIVFRLKDPITGSTLLTASSSIANAAVADEGMVFIDVPYAANPTDRFTQSVIEFEHPVTGDRVYTIRKRQEKALKNKGYVSNGDVFTAYPGHLRGLDPIWQLESPTGLHTTTGNRQERDQLINEGWQNEGPAFFSVVFDNVGLG